MSAPTLQDFVDDELMRAPMLLDAVFDATALAWRQARASAPTDDLLRHFTRDRALVLRETMGSLRAQIAAEMAGTPAASPGAAGPALDDELSLVDDDAVAADIELTRVVQQVKLVAEFELLELQACTSALVGDRHVARDTNPLRPTTWARALFDGAQAAGLPRALQAALLHAAAEPLSQALRQAYAQATARLASQGLEPGDYRTIVRHLGRAEDEDDAGISRPSALDTLTELRDSMPMPLEEPQAQPEAFEAALQRIDLGLRNLPADAGPQARQARETLLASGRGALLGSAGSRVDQQLVEMVSRLFEALLAERRLTPGTLAFISRLQPTVLRLALRDAALLRDWAHPAWRFLDQLVFLHEQLAARPQARAAAHLRGVLDLLLRDGMPDAARFAWGLERLVAFERHVFSEARQASAELMGRVQEREGTPHSGHTDFSPSLPLDIGTLDTVPAALTQDSRGPGSAALDAAEPGQWLRLHLQGAWRTVLLLWRSEAAWLLLLPAEDRHWVLRRRALDHLAAAGLAGLQPPPPRVRRAAERVMRALEAEAAR